MGVVAIGICVPHERQCADIAHQPRRGGRREQSERTEYADDIEGARQQKARPGEHLAEFRPTIQLGPSG